MQFVELGFGFVARGLNRRSNGSFVRTGFFLCALDLCVSHGVDRFQVAILLDDDGMRARRFLRVRQIECGDDFVSALGDSARVGGFVTGKIGFSSRTGYDQSEGKVR